MRPFLLLAAVFIAGPALAYDANDPHNCNGVEWNDKRAQIVARVIAKPRINFVKSPYDDDFTASACPNETDACRLKSYLVPGDLVLVGPTQDAFTCVVFQSPVSKNKTWSKGWLPTSSLQPVAPMPHPKISDWLGTWSHPGGDIEISKTKIGKLHVEGEMVVPTARDFHSGVVQADIVPGVDTIAFADDGSGPFDAEDAGCRVRMQRIGSYLMVEDNSGCGGAGVTFTGLYRRGK